MAPRDKIKSIRNFFFSDLAKCNSRVYRDFSGSKKWKSYLRVFKKWLQKYGCCQWCTPISQMCKISIANTPYFAVYTT
jgi:hypothetical protein